MGTCPAQVAAIAEARPARTFLMTHTTRQSVCCRVNYLRQYPVRVCPSHEHISSVAPTLEHHGGPIMHSGVFCVKTDCVARIAKFCSRK